MQVVLISLLCCIVLHACVEVLAARGTLLNWTVDRPGLFNALMVAYIASFTTFFMSIIYLLWSLA